MSAPENTIQTKDLNPDDTLDKIEGIEFSEEAKEAGLAPEAKAEAKPEVKSQEDEDLMAKFDDEKNRPEEKPELATDKKKREKDEADAKKLAEESKELEQEGEEKTDEKSSEEGEKGEEKSSDAEPFKPRSRDYEGLSVQEAHFGKQMSNSAFQYYKKAIKERNIHLAEKKELEQKLTQVSEGAIPQSYYEHEEAYKLTPQYEDTAKNIELAKVVYAHWKKQATLVESGEQWRTLDYDDKTGKFILGAPQDFDAASKIEIQENLAGARQQFMQFQQELQTLQVQHKVKHKEIVGEMQSYEDKYFPQFQDEKFEGWQVAKDVKKYLESKGMAKNPLINLVAKAAAANTLLVKRLEGNQKQKIIKNGVKEDAKKAGPTNAKFGGAVGKSGGSTEVSIDDFNKELGRA